MILAHYLFCAVQSLGHHLQARWPWGSYLTLRALVSWPVKWSQWLCLPQRVVWSQQRGTTQPSVCSESVLSTWPCASSVIAAPWGWNHVWCSFTSMPCKHVSLWTVWENLPASPFFLVFALSNLVLSEVPGWACGEMQNPLLLCG